MQLVLLRHGIAEEREIFAESGQSDELRPLTLRGRRRMHKIASEMQRFVSSLDLIVTSPLVRATQTAQVVSEYFPTVPVLETPTLSPEEPASEFTQWMQEHIKGFRRILAVGHEPNLGAIGSWLLCTERENFLKFKKGGLACFEFEFHKEVRASSAQLRWLVQPKHFE